MKKQMLAILAASLMVAATPIFATTNETVVSQEVKSFALEDGTYSVPVSLVKTNNTNLSMANSCLDSEATIIVEKGEAKVYLSFKPLSMFGLKGYLSSVSYFNSEAEFTAFEAGDASLAKAATVEQVIEGTDYPEVISFELTELRDYTYLNMDISIGMNQSARVKMDVAHLAAK